ncbi:MAG: S8 family serine peptidase [Thermoplasmata archaeon]
MRPKRRALVKIISLSVVFALTVPAIWAVYSSSEMNEEMNDVRIYFSGRSDSEALRNLAIKELYDGFAIAQVTERQRRILESVGYLVENEPFLHTIALNGHIFDTRFGEPSLDESLRMDAYPNGEAGYYIVQFTGPIKEEWKNKVGSFGVEIDAYLPNNAFLINMNAEEREMISQLDFVQWTGIFQPAYKIRPELLELEDEFEVEIVTYTGEGIYSVLSMLEESQTISFYEGEDFGLVKAIIHGGSLPDLARLGSVRYIEPFYEPTLTNQYMQWVHQTNVNNNRKLWTNGINGFDQVIAFADTGLDYDHKFFREDAGTIYIGDLYNVTDYGRRKLVRYMAMSTYVGVDPWTGGDIWAHRDSWPPRMGYQTSGHGTMVSGTGAGSDDDVGGVSGNDGLAKGAQIYLQDIGTVCKPEPGSRWDDCLRYIPDDYQFLYGPAYDDGVRIHSNSWGTRDSTYDLEAMMTDKFMWNHPDMLVIFSNGNGGPAYPPANRYDVGSPATAKSIVSAGAAGNARSLTGRDQNDVAGYSSLGPTADGRLKPTVTMVGEGYSSRSDGNPWSNGNPMDTGWLGTSYAAPAAAGASSMIRQYFVDGWYPTGVAVSANGFEPSAALMKGVLAISGQKITGSYRDSKGEQTWPNNSQGWGRPLLDKALYFSGDARELAVVEHKQGLLTGDEVEYKFFVNAGEELKIQLVWTDYPGTLGATTALVNDLHLEVTAPTSAVYKGNVFSIPFGASESIVGGLFDSVNPIEGVRLSSPSTGVWKVRIIGENVPNGPQPFALVVSGDLDWEYGQVFIDKEIYSDQDTINIEVQDLDAASVTVTVTSTTEPSGETVVLDPVGGFPNGIFRGFIDTKFEAPSPNGTLEVADNDIIIVTYHDTSPDHISTADAKVDASGPIIYDVFVKDITNAAATITWKTDEPSDSRVFWGATSSLGMVSYEPELATYHTVDLIGLETGRTYYFDVESTDWFSHTILETNGGSHYTFTTTDMGEIMLVIGHDSFPPERVQSYKNALEWGGWTYNLRYVDRSGDPPLSVLQQYKVVAWQTGLEQYPPFEDNQTVLVKDYLDGGGRLFVSSHDVAWAFSPTSGSQFSTPERYEFLRSTLKADHKEDPYTWSHAEGIIGDPISSSYALGSRISYTYHRRGASGDEVAAEPAGGTTFYVWKSYGLESNYDNAAVRWFSSALNDSVSGDDPDIVWDNHTSKLVVFFLEFTGLDYSRVLSDIRGDVLNKTILWLLNDTYHPVVDVSYPNGAETFTRNTVNIYWNRTATPSVSNQAVYYSDDSGQTWFLIEGNIAPGQTSYVWDISTLENGNRYLVKVVVQDTNTPPLNGTDTSDGTFTINRPGGDTTGPRTVPGSVKASPHPATTATPIHFNGIVFDNLTGNSVIGEAEFFVNDTEPSPGVFGTGTPMTATDGSFDSQWEPVEWLGPLTSPWNAVGNYTIWIHGRDDPDGVPSSGDENWGTFYSTTFQVIHPPPDVSVQAPTFISAELTGALFADVRIVWGLSPDDPAVGGAADVDRYEIMRGTVYDPTGTGYAYLGQVGAGQTSYVASGDGDGDVNNYFYQVVAVDTSDNRAPCPDQAGKFTEFLGTGVNLVSTPLMPSDSSTSVLFQTLDFDTAWTYDSFAQEWKSYSKLKPYYGDFLSVGHKMGIWVNVLSDDYFTVAGIVPTGTTIQLYAGWNLVGYPSFTDRTVLLALTGISYQRVEGFNATAAPYNLMALSPASLMTAGEGFWIYSVDTVWVVPQ